MNDWQERFLAKAAEHKARWAAKIGVWKCGDCFHANKGTKQDPCLFCGSGNRVPLMPVEVPNAQQNTPDLSRLEQEMAIEEANRHTDRSICEQVRDLINDYLKEKEDGKADDSSP